MAGDSLGSGSAKKPWQRPDNWVTYGILAVLGYLGLTSLDKILPLVIRVFENTLYAAGLFGALGVLGFLVVNKDIHRLVWYGYRVAMRWLTERFVTLDPIAILEEYVRDLHGNLGKIKESLETLRGQKRKIEAIIHRKGEDYDRSMQQMSSAQARSKGKEGGDRAMNRHMMLQSRKAGRLEKSAVTYQGLLSRLNAHIAITEKIGEAAEFMVADIEDTVAEEKEKRATIKESHRAMAASKRILQAGQQRELYDMAMEHITNDYFQKLGEIEQFMRDSESFVAGVDIDNGVFEAQAVERLAEWEKRSENLLSGGSGKTKFRVEPAHLDSDGESEGAEAGKRQSYADLFDQLK